MRSSLFACVVVAGSLGLGLQPAPAAPRVVVPHTLPDGNHVLRVKPTTLALPFQIEGLSGRIVFRKIVWRGWGSSVARGKATVRLCTDGIGCTTQRGTLRLSQVGLNACGHGPSRRMYNWATGVGFPILGRYATPTMVC